MLQMKYGGSTISAKIFAYVFLWIFVLNGTGLHAIAQEYSITGTIADETTGSPISDANIFLNTFHDSVFVRGTVSTEHGEFTFRNISPGLYYISASHIGYQSDTLTVEIRDRNVTGLTLGLKPRIFEYDEVLVIDRRPPVILRGDTTQYNTDAYQMRRDAWVEDLLLRLPGIMIINGRVYAQGEVVERILVDGEEFFEGDISIVLRNIPAQIVRHVEVYDQASDQAQFTGFNDGDSRRIINIVTRHGMDKGHFGNFQSSYGTDSRYLGGGAVHHFNGPRRVSILGLSNNLNQMNMPRSGLFGRGEQQTGISTIHSTGVNFSDHLSDSWQVSGNYLFNFIDNISEQNIERNYLTGFGADHIYNEHNRSTSENYNHSFRIRLDYTIDGKRSLLIVPIVIVRQSGIHRTLEGVTMAPENVYLNQLHSNQTTDNLNYILRNSILYRHRLEKPGRTFSVDLRTDLNKHSGNRFQYHDNIFYGDTYTTVLIDQNTDSNNKGSNVSINISYTEPVGDKSNIMITYRPSLHFNEIERYTFGFNQEADRYSELDSLLSNRYDDLITTHNIKTSYRYSTSDYNLGVGLAYRYSMLKGNRVFPCIVETGQNWGSVLPDISFHYRINMHSNLRVFYETDTQYPSVWQLQNVIDNTNPMRLTVGNPDLSYQYSHRFTVSYNIANPVKGINTLFTNHLFITNNVIGNRTIVAERDSVLDGGIIFGKGSRLLTPINVGNSYALQIAVSRGMPADIFRSRINMNVGVNYRRTPSYLNKYRNMAENLSVNGYLWVNSNISEQTSFSSAYSGSYTIINNSITSDLDRQYFTGRATVRYATILWNAFVVASDVNIAHYAGLGDEYDRTIIFWNPSIGFKFMNNRAAEITLTVFDVFAQNDSINRNVSEDFVEDLRSNVISQYFLLTFNYNFQRFFGQE